jgi:intermediate cleaving peptidase 55
MSLRSTICQSLRYARYVSRARPTFRRTLQHYQTYATVSAADLSFGQPLHETHPHILKSGELTPGITALEYAQRRTKLAAKLPANSIAIVAASDIQYRSGHCFYEFYQDPDFFYLTGFNEPKALAVIGKDDTGKDHTFYLYVREKDSKVELWDGARSGTQAAIDVFNADESGDISNVMDTLPDVITGASQIFTEITTPYSNSLFHQFFHGGPTPKIAEFATMIEPNKLRGLRSIMNDLRAFKSPAEIENMRIAGKASGRAHTEVMRQSFTKEKDLDAFFRYRLSVNGSEALAFEPIVAGAQNALGIHYVRNDDVLHNDKLVLVDGGGKYGGYSADISRTWPVSGKFSDAQRDLYGVVLKVHRSMISMCRGAANMSLEKLHTIAQNALEEQLKQIGFDMSGNAIRVLFPHHLSHYLGLDVHDCIGYSKETILREGHCITIEPGIYVPFDNRWPKHFQGMGIRIEDSISIQEDNPYVLTTEAVKEVADIEALRD